MRHFGSQIVKKNCIVHTRCFHRDDHGRHWVLCLSDLTFDCSKSVFIHPLMVPLGWCVSGSNQESICVCNARWCWQLATRCSAAGCVLTTVILVIQVVWAIRSARLQIWLGSFWIITCVLLTLWESILQCGAGKHDQWRGYLTVRVINHGIMTSISMLASVILPMIRFDVDIPWDCFRQQVKMTLAIHLQLSTVSALDLNCVHHLPHALLQEKDTYCLPEGNQWIPNALRRIQSRADQRALLWYPLWNEWNRIKPYPHVHEPGTRFGMQYPMRAVASAYHFQDLLCAYLKCYGPNVAWLHSGVAVFLYYLPVWGFSKCCRNASHCISYHFHVACTHKWPSVPHVELQESTCCKYKASHVRVTKSMDAATAGDHWSRCRHLPLLQLPMPLSPILSCSLRPQWICNDPAGFWIEVEGRHVFQTAERSGSASNAGCGDEYSVSWWGCLWGSSGCPCATTAYTQCGGWSIDWPSQCGGRGGSHALSHICKARIVQRRWGVGVLTLHCRCYGIPSLGIISVASQYRNASLWSGEVENFQKAHANVLSDNLQAFNQFIRPESLQGEGFGTE